MATALYAAVCPGSPPDISDPYRPIDTPAGTGDRAKSGWEAMLDHLANPHILARYVATQQNLFLQIYPFSIFNRKDQLLGSRL